MIVLDASATVEALVGIAPSDELLELLAGDIQAPHLLDVEVMSALRGLTRGGRLSPERAEHAWRDYMGFNIVRHEMEPVAERVWHLRHQVTSYDAFYIALAEALAAPLVTCDEKLATAGHSARVLVVP